MINKQNTIAGVTAREILDSRGNPTIEATVWLEDGTFGTAAAPSGASTGKYEAHELRDGAEKRYRGKGVLQAVENVRDQICGALRGMPCCQSAVDTRMIHLDDTENKKRLGANAMLAVSMACAKAGAWYHREPLYKYIGGISGARLPTPMMNILNGGAHADNNLDIQEFMIMPVGFTSFREALRAGAEIYHVLGKILKTEGKSTAVGDEGGFAPDMRDNDEVLSTLVRAIEEAGYTTDQIKIAMDAASSEWVDEKGKYTLPKAGGSLDHTELTGIYEKLAAKYPLVSLEDGLGEDDHAGWKAMTERLGRRMLLVGDDYFVTNPKKLAQGIENGCGNAILVKPNQIGTLTETIDVVNMAKANGYRTILSHRSGETGDTTIADLAVGLNAGFIKTGAPCRAERTEKYNRLLAIEEELAGGGMYGGNI
ncbi:MAG: phosphopyruvate hydratase [Clostridia bacterium]|nr:phosphopyruvate hydratase [Clostridia bacterium]